MRWRGSSRNELPIEELRSQLHEEFRATPSDDGGVRVAVNNDESGNWAEIEVGTGDIPDLIRLLEDARAAAQASLDATSQDRPDT